MTPTHPPTHIWTTPDVASYLNVTTATITAYRSRGQMPPPDGYTGRTPWWHPTTITTWHHNRPRPQTQNKPTRKKPPPPHT